MSWDQVDWKEAFRGRVQDDFREVFREFLRYVLGSCPGSKTVMDSSWVQEALQEVCDALADDDYFLSSRDVDRVSCIITSVVRRGWSQYLPWTQIKVSGTFGSLSIRETISMKDCVRLINSLDSCLRGKYWIKVYSSGDKLEVCFE